MRGVLHFEFVCGIPSALFAIGTYKKNGKPNVCFHAWSAFQGEGDGYYVILVFRKIITTR
ncbi:MAG TPA: hypothetical protein PLO54_01685 [Bacilli bacterium]|nr:hypothetical protein [Bacilli bacterium]